MFVFKKARCKTHIVSFFCVCIKKSICPEKKTRRNYTKLLILKLSLNIEVMDHVYFLLCNFLCFPNYLYCVCTLLSYENIFNKKMITHAYVRKPPFKKSPKGGVRSASGVRKAPPCWEHGAPQPYRDRAPRSDPVGLAREPPCVPTVVSFIIS